MPSADHHMDRYHKHSKWARYHLLIAGLSTMTVVGVLWSWLFVIKWYQHRSRAKSQRQKANEADAA